MNQEIERSIIQKEKKSYWKCVWMRRINSAIYANANKSETKLEGMLYFLPGILSQSLAITSWNKIFK